MILITMYSFAATNCVPNVTVFVALKLLSKLPSKQPALSPTCPVENDVAKSIQPVDCEFEVVGSLINTFKFDELKEVPEFTIVPAAPFICKENPVFDPPELF